VRIQTPMWTVCRIEGVPLAPATFRGTSGAAREMRYTLAMFLGWRQDVEGPFCTAGRRGMDLGPPRLRIPDSMGHG